MEQRDRYILIMFIALMVVVGGIFKMRMDRYNQALQLAEAAPQSATQLRTAVPAAVEPSPKAALTPLDATPAPFDCGHLTDVICVYSKRPGTQVRPFAERTCFALDPGAGHFCVRQNIELADETDPRSSAGRYACSVSTSIGRIESQNDPTLFGAVQDMVHRCEKSEQSVAHRVRAVAQ